MDQSLSGGSTPSRMTLTVICLFRESSDMPETLYHRPVKSGLIEPLVRNGRRSDCNC